MKPKRIIRQRHKARVEEQQREIPAKPRFNQQVTDEDNPNYMYPLNRDIPDDCVSLLEFNCESIERGITETANMIEISIRATIQAAHGSPVFDNFIGRLRSNPNGLRSEPNFENCFQYEGTLYCVSEISVDTSDSSLWGGDVLRADPFMQLITLSGVALPQIIKLKRG